MTTYKTLTLNFSKLTISMLAIFLAGCSSGLSSEQLQTKIDSDFNSLVRYASEFDANSSAANNDTSTENLIRVSEKNKEILNNMEVANEGLYQTLMDNWDSIAEGENEYSPGKEIIRDFSLGYKTWIKYQRMNAQIGDDCIYNSANALDCIALNFNNIMENEYQSRIKINEVSQKTAEWREKFNR
jgi:hypothetical protein